MDTAAVDDQDVVNADCESVQLPQEPSGPGGGQPGPGTTTDTTPPALTLAAAKRRLGAFRSKGLRVTMSCSEACQYALTLQIDKRTARRLKLSRTIGRAKGARIAAGRFTVTVKLSRKTARKLARLRSLKLSIALTAADAAGNRSAMKRSLTLKR